MSVPAAQTIVPLSTDARSTALVVVGALAAAVVGLTLNGLLRRAAVLAERVEDREFCA